MASTPSPPKMTSTSLSNADRVKKEEYFQLLEDAIRTNPYRKAANAAARVMHKHGIGCESSSVFGKPPPESAPEKKCALTKSLRLGQSCNQKLNQIRDDLQTLCKGAGKAVKTHPPPPLPPSSSQVSGDGPQVSSINHSDKAVMAGHLVALIGEAVTISKRIYETAVGLHIAEDYLRQPEDIKLLDFSPSGRIQIPNYNFHHSSQLCLEWIHSTAYRWFREFKDTKKSDEEQVSKFLCIYENFTKAMKDYTVAVTLANHVFRVLLYPNTYGKECLQEYINALGHVLKSDVIMEVQALRRTFDAIQCTFERLGWTAYLVWMKYSGKTATVETINKHGAQMGETNFQSKLYEATGRKIKQDSNRGRNNKKLFKVKTSTTSLKATESERTVGHKMEQASGEAGNILPAKEGGKDVSDKIASQPGPRATKRNQDQSFKKLLREMIQPEDGVGQIRKTRSSSDVAKLKKVAKKTIKGKKTRARENNDVQSPPTTGTTGSGIAIDNEFVVPIPVRASKSNQLQQRSATAIPLALHRQFNAVFGMNLAPQKGGRIVKKKAEKKSRTPTAESTATVETR